MRQGMFGRVLVVIAFSVLFPGCSLVDSLTGPGKSDVEYRVSGTAVRVSLRYETASGTSESASTMLPWSFTRKAEEDDLLYVSARVIEGDGTVTATIYKEGELMNSSTSTGVGAIATASGTLH